jgi:hypothetical protein
MSYPPQQPPVMPGYTPPPQGDWTPTPKRSGIRPIAWAALAVAAVVLGTAGWFAYRTFAPAGSPGAAPDSGIEACKAMRDTPVAENGKQKPLTEQRYREIRTMFEDSRDPDIRSNGTKLIDIAWQISQDESQAFAYLSPMMSALTGLQTACANHGIILPAGTQSGGVAACKDIFATGKIIDDAKAKSGCKSPNGQLQILGYIDCSNGKTLYSVDARTGAPVGWGYGGEKFHAVKDIAADAGYGKAYQACNG